MAKYPTAITGAYSVAKHKELRTSDGYAMTGVLCRNGKPIGTYEDGGYGGPMDVRFTDGPNGPDALLFKNYLDSLPTERFHDMDLKVDVGMLICSLIEDFLNAKRIARLWKTSVLFRLPGDKEDTMRTVKHGGKVAEARAYVAKKYPTATFVEG